jgi:hypothetical protein
MTGSTQDQTQPSDTQVPYEPPCAVLIGSLDEITMGSGAIEFDTQSGSIT